MSALIDVTGKRFGRLTAIKHQGKDKWGNALWTVLCDCGRENIVRGYILRTGMTRSCGCLVKDTTSENFRKHCESGGFGNTGATPEYRAYRAAISRCTNPNVKCWPRYGGRGIEFRFTSFEQWLVELGRKPSPTHSVDRIKVNGNYEPGNVRWATPSEQRRNQRAA
jgi:hypothetical protein